MSSQATDPVNALVHWAKVIDPDDLVAAETFLSIAHGPSRALAMTHALRGAYTESGIQVRRANDILRAAELKPLGDDDPGVFHARLDILKGKPLPPVLVVGDGTFAQIADGYHRISAVYNLDPFADVHGVFAYSRP